MKRIKVPDWAINFLIVLLLALAFTSLRKLYGVGQPILGIIVDSVAMAAIFAFLAYIFLDRQPPT
ncbi:MAG TPA: hypothetical protein VKP61_14700 [Candidatus Acidoferrum sp.]|nr:hypothetical protein [Candidatus Acidoferrum sp.]